MGYYKLNASKINNKSQTYKILNYINQNDKFGGASKYDCLINALGKIGTRESLRGYYCCAFRGLVDNGVLVLDRRTHKYSITPEGFSKLNIASKRD